MRTRGHLAGAILTMLCLGLSLCPERSPARSARGAALEGGAGIQHRLPYAPACNLPTDPARASCVFESLSHATVTWKFPGNEKRSNTLAPLWQDWENKCSLLLANCAPGLAKFAHSEELVPSDLVAATTPLQFDMPNFFKAHTFDARKLEFASVLFSPEIAGPIQSQKLNTQASLNSELKQVANERGYKREIDTIIGQNAILTKLIWEVVLPKKDNAYHQFPVRVFDDSIQPGDRDEITNWPSYEVDDDETKPCEDVGPPLAHPAQETEASKAKTISPNCFYHHVLDAPADSAVYAQLNQPLLATITSMKPPTGAKVLLLLVGAHFMQFNQTHQTWQWMTFYWKRNAKDVPSSWMNPWKHYEMMTTSAPEELKAPSIQPLANPYLEVQNGPNGASTNCISCHSLAAYDRRLSVFGAATAFALQDRRYPNTEVDFDLKKKGFDQAVRTHFIWSLVRNDKLKPEGTP